MPGSDAHDGCKPNPDSSKGAVHYKLDSISEQRVMKQGVLTLQTHLAQKFTSEELLELPRRRDGAQLFMRPSFYQRLLKGLELKTLLEGDVSAAQSDVKHLRLEQLLTIRAGTLDWATESETHSAHTCFLTSLDQVLFERLARHFLGSPALEPSGKPSNAFRALGVRLALVLGAQEVMASGQWHQADSQERPPLPRLWALGLNSADWPGFRAVVVHTGEFWAKLLAGNEADFVEASSGNQIAVPVDRSTGEGKDRRLHWEINVIDPKVDDIQGEIDKDLACRDRKNISDELHTVLKERMNGRREQFGLPLDSTPRRTNSNELSRALNKRLAGRTTALGLPSLPNTQTQKNTDVKEVHVEHEVQPSAVVACEELNGEQNPQTEQTAHVEQISAEQEPEVGLKSMEMDVASPRPVEQMQETPARKVKAPWDCHISIDDGLTPPRPTKIYSARSEPSEAKAAPDSAKRTGIREQCWEAGADKNMRSSSPHQIDESRSNSKGKDASGVKDNILSGYVPDCFAGMVNCGNRCSCS